MKNWTIYLHNFDAFRFAFNVGLGFTCGAVLALVLLYAVACVCKWLIGG